MPNTDITDKPITVTWKGKTYRVVPSAEWTIETLEAMEDGKMTHMLRGMLAGDGYTRLRETKPLISDLQDLFEKIQKALGISGN
jgi:hypothetical protein